MEMYSVRLLVQDFGACFRFYRDVIGLAPVWGDEAGPYADFPAGDETMISLFSRDLMAEAVGTTDLPSAAREQDRFVVVLQVDDVDAVHKRLAEKGADFVNGPKDYPAWTIRAAHLRDPDGNLLELFSPLARQQWTEEVEQKDPQTVIQG
ncbi:VOC family protein [Chelativorans alearense]|uniref:VOC family protein n=1 Tax=Chelativorans alearense TaxID=2681495 RepID=UPI0013D1C091|nr:VOC family protein [Chelativorans alearense]